MVLVCVLCGFWAVCLVGSVLCLVWVHVWCVGSGKCFPWVLVCVLCGFWNVFDVGSGLCVVLVLQYRYFLLGSGVCFVWVLECV